VRPILLAYCPLYYSKRRKTHCVNTREQLGKVAIDEIVQHDSRNSPLVCKWLESGEGERGVEFGLATEGATDVPSLVQEVYGSVHGEVGVEAGDGDLGSGHLGGGFALVVEC